MATAHHDKVPALDVEAVRRHFAFPALGRVVTNNAASTQPPRELTALYSYLVPGYENVHRGQSRASRAMTAQFEGAYRTIARFINAPGPENIVLHGNATAANNAVMYAMLTELRDGDNIVATMLEHNSNYVPWHALCREILPRLGVRVELRLARFDRRTGALDLGHLASLVDGRTKLVACTGASNFLGTLVPLPAVRQIASASGYVQPGGERRSLLLVDGAQLVPGAAVDVQALDVDYLSFSFHKMLAPFGVGVLYGKRHLLAAGRPLFYGGDMVAEGQVFEDRVEYAPLPWRHAAGTPNILGAIVSAEALRLLLDLALSPRQPRFFQTDRPMTRTIVEAAMARIKRHTRSLTRRALEALRGIEGLTIYGPEDAERRTSLVSFNVAGWHPKDLADALDGAGIEARAGCHCAALAHRHLGIEPAASCRLSFYLYNTTDDVDRATGALAAIVAGRRRPSLPARTWARVTA
jgi:cysteine desulfurase / selenocysteine lyase